MNASVASAGLLGIGLALVLAVGWWWVRSRLLIVTVYGPSMMPTYRDGDRLLVRRMPTGRLHPGQVVVVELLEPRMVGPAGTMHWGTGAAEQVRQLVVKRVAAVSGDSVPAGVSAESARVPAGKVVLLGDNPARSVDSRHYGWADADRVVGVALRLLHPDGRSLRRWGAQPDRAPAPGGRRAAPAPSQQECRLSRGRSGRPRAG